MHEAGLVLSGIIIATIVMSVGIGGGILWTPLLILVYDLSPQEAIATAIFIQVAGTGSGTFAFIRNGFVQFKLFLLIFLVALPGIIAGSFFTVQISPDIVKLAIGVMAMLLALNFVANKTAYSEPEPYQFSIRNSLKILPIPAFFGFVMGFLSVGVSEWLIPALRSHLKLSMSQAIGTAISVTFALVCVSSVIHYSNAQTSNLHYLLWGATGTIIGAQIGVHIAKRINEQILKQAFIYLMTLVGIHLIFQAF